MNVSNVQWLGEVQLNDAILIEMTNAFLRHPLPESVCADPCATKQQPGRIGTNLLSFSEAREILGAIVGPTIQKAKEQAASLCQDADNIQNTEAYKTAKLIADLRQRAEKAERKCEEMEAGMSVIFNKLDEGTLHVIYCNGNHNERVGKEGMICNCTLGVEIQDLRRQIASAKAERDSFYADYRAKYDVETKRLYTELASAAERINALQRECEKKRGEGAESIMRIWYNALGDQVYPKAHHIDELGKTTRRLTEDRNKAWGELSVALAEIARWRECAEKLAPHAETLYDFLESGRAMFGDKDAAILEKVWEAVKAHRALAGKTEGGGR